MKGNLCRDEKQIETILLSYLFQILLNIATESKILSRFITRILISYNSPL